MVFWKLLFSPIVAIATIIVEHLLWVLQALVKMIKVHLVIEMWIELHCVVFTWSNHYIFQIMSLTFLDLFITLLNVKVVTKIASRYERPHRVVALFRSVIRVYIRGPWSNLDLGFILMLTLNSIASISDIVRNLFDHFLVFWEHRSVKITFDEGHDLCIILSTL